jgi:hypothetical protein
MFTDVEVARDKCTADLPDTSEVGFRQHHLVHTRLEVGDPVYVGDRVKRRVKDELIGPASARQLVVAVAAIELVFAAAADEAVIAAFAEDRP